MHGWLARLEGKEDAFLAFNAGFGKFDLHAEFGWERHERGDRGHHDPLR